MRKPNVIFLSIIAMAALLPHTTRWMDDRDEPVATVNTSPSVAKVKPASGPAQPAPEEVAATRAATPETLEARAPAEHPADEPHPWHVLPIEEPAEAGEPLATLEEIYLNEGFDPEWAGPLEEDFYRTFETANLSGSAVEQAECRATLCRFAILHQDSAAQDEFIQAFLKSPLLPLINQGAIAHHSQPAADGTVSAVYFLARNELAHVHH